MKGEARPANQAIWSRRISCFVVAVMALAQPVRADDYAKNEERLKSMTPDQKDELRRKKNRFDDLSADEQQRLRGLHASISGDPQKDELMDTVKSYTRWLATLDSSERSDLLDIADPQQRIVRIKELIQQQEKRRFDQYFANLPDDDRKAIFQWLNEFVVKREEVVMEKLPPPFKQRIESAPDSESRRREMFASWLRHLRDFDLPYPTDQDYPELLTRFSPETKKTIESSVASELTKEAEENRTPERQQALQQQKLGDLVRTALYSRFFPQVSQQELLKYYAAMKSDDQRRKQLEGKEGEDLRRELQRMYNWDHGFGRGGPPGGRGGPGGPGFTGGRGFGPGWGPPGGRGDGGRGDGRGGPPPGGKPGDRFGDKFGDKKEGKPSQGERAPPGNG